MTEEVETPMSEVAPPAEETKVKPGPKSVKEAITKKPKSKPTHPTAVVMVEAAIGNLKEKSGSSLVAIKKYIATNYKVDVVKLNPHIKKALVNGVEKKTLIRVKGKGASGSFKLGKSEKSEKPKKKVVKKAKAVKAPKAKKAKTEKKEKTPKKAEKAKEAKEEKKSVKKATKSPKSKKAPPKKAAPKEVAQKKASKAPAKSPAKKESKKPAAKKATKKAAAAKKPAKKAAPKKK